MTVERWIRLIAGVFILASLALGVWVNKWWLLFTTFVGLNLVQSSFTNWCLMEILLKKAGVKCAPCDEKQKFEGERLMRVVAGILVLVALALPVFSNQTANYVYLIVAVFVSLLYALFAVDIFTEPGTFKGLSTSKKIREITFHLAGSAIGFALLYYLIRKAQFSIYVKNYNLINITDVLLLLVSFIGISGYLPYVAGVLSNKLAGLLGKTK